MSVATPKAESREGPSPSPDASLQRLRGRTRVPRTAGNTGLRPLQARWSRTSASAHSARSSRAHTRGSGDPWRLRPGAFLCPWRRFRQNPRPTLLDLWLVLARRTSGLAPRAPKGRGQAPRLSCAHPRRSGRVAEGGALLRRYGGECLHRGFESLLLRFTHGEVSEWPKERDWKSRTC